MIQFYFCCRGDTKGIVEDDWRTVRFDKINLCSRLFGLTPWYGIGASAQSAPAEPPPPQVITTILGAAPPASVSGNVPPSTPPPAEQLAVQSSSASVQSEGSAVLQQPLSKPLSGLVFPFEALQVSNDTGRGDLARQIQRIVALGLTAVIVPFSFENITDQAYLPDLVRECNATAEADFRASLLPPDFDPITLAGMPLPQPLGIVTNSTKIPACNWYFADINGLQRFLSLVRVFLQNGLDVVLQNTDTALILDDPSAWVTRWVELSTHLVDLQILSGRLHISPLKAEGAAQLQWASQNGNPGLTDIYRTVFPAIDQLLPEVLYLIEGVGGNDFTGATPLLQQTQSSPRNGRVIPVAADLAGLTNATTQFEYLAKDGVCLTASLCTFYTLASTTRLPIDPAYIPFLRNSTWFAEAIDPVDFSWAEVANLTVIGLRPWYSPQSAYNRLPGEAIRAVVGQQSSGFSDYPCNATVTLSEVSSGFPATALLSVTVTNLKDVTLTPPYELQVNSTSLQQGIQAFGISNYRAGSGSITGTLNNYYDILWPRGKNSVTALFVVQLGATTLTNITVGAAGLVCSTVVL